MKLGEYRRLNSFFFFSYLFPIYFMKNKNEMFFTVLRHEGLVFVYIEKVPKVVDKKKKKNQFVVFFKGKVFVNMEKKEIITSLDKFVSFFFLAS